jgi:hypothetical protein
MPAHDGGAAHIVSGIGKPSGNEPARYGSQLGRECYEGLAQMVSVTSSGMDVRPSHLSRALSDDTNRSAQADRHDEILSLVAGRAGLPTDLC